MNIMHVVYTVGSSKQERYKWTLELSLREIDRDAWVIPM